MSTTTALRLVLAPVTSPIGTIHCVTAGSVLVALEFAEYDLRRERLMRARFGDFALIEDRLHEPIARALERYFAGDLAAIDAVTVDPGAPCSSAASGMLCAESHRAPQ